MGVASFSFRVWGCPPTFAKGTSIFFYYYYFFVISDLLTPHAYAPPWTPLNPGFYSISWSSKHSLVLHDGPPWKVALCLPYPTVPSPPDHESQGRSNQLRNTLAKLVGITPHVSHIVDRSPNSSPTFGITDGMRQSLGRTFFRDADPHKSFGENLLVSHPWKVEQP